MSVSNSFLFNQDLSQNLYHSPLENCDIEGTSETPSNQEKDTLSNSHNVLPITGNFETEKAILPKKGRVDVSSYSALHQKIKQHECILSIHDETGNNQVKVLHTLGSGGAKRIYEIENNQALALPNFSADPIFAIAKRWRRVVSEEVGMSKILNSLGLLSPMSKQINISFSEISNDIPAYISETFENLTSTKNWFIIDFKNWDSSTWKKGGNYLFASKKERFCEENWEYVLDPLLDDIAKICIFDIPITRDSSNMAIVRQKKSDSDQAISEYQIRYFGFDFSNKSDSLLYPSIEIKTISSFHKDIKSLLSTFINQIFLYEFDVKQDCDHDEIKLLKTNLIEKCIEKILVRITVISTKLEPLVNENNGIIIIDDEEDQYDELMKKIQFCIS